LDYCPQAAKKGRIEEDGDCHDAAIGLMAVDFFIGLIIGFIFHARRIRAA
jgi:hypothetical protein